MAKPFLQYLAFYNDENVPIKKNVTGMLKYLTVTLFTVKIDTNAKVL